MTQGSPFDLDVEELETAPESGFASPLLTHGAPALAGLLGALLVFACGTLALSSLGVGVFLYVVTRFLMEWGHEIPINTLILLTAGLQWIVGPLLSYSGIAPHYKYFMYVPEARYMTLAVPGYLSMVLGVYLFHATKHRAQLTTIRDRAEAILHRNDVIPIAITALGVVASALGQIAPGGLRFALFLVGEAKYVGVLYFIFSGRRERWVVFASLLAFAALSALDEAMFHNLFLWTVLLLLYLGLVFRWSATTRLVLVLVGVVLLAGLLSVKREYRYTLWDREYEGNKAVLMGHLLNERMNAKKDARTDAITEIVIRINQGWIISRIMEQVPEVTPFARGDTVRSAVLSSFLPRLLFPDKAEAGGRVNFARFTGYELEGTSMGLSLVGEGYANFGRAGACVFLFLYGAMISLLFRGLYSLALKIPTLILWMPLIFLQVIKAETELLVVLNHLTKSVVIVAFLVWGMQRVLKWKV